MTQITDFIPQYQEVNVIFSRFLESEKFGFEEQKNITHFYNRYKDVKLFEKMIFDIIFSKDSRREKMLLSNIKFEIDRNITIYETGRHYFDEIEMENVNDDAAVKYLEEIETQVRVTNQCGAEFLEVAALWENCFNLHGIDHDAWEKYDSLLEKHHTEIEKLNELYRKHKAVMEEAKEYEENMFRPIYELSKIFLSIIQKYMPVEGEQPQSTNDATTPYFDMALVSAIYGVCNGEQFEDIPELEFYNNLNLLSSSDRLRIRPKEKARVCYLVYLLSERLPKTTRESWRSAMLETLGIDAAYYKSKYKEPESDFPSDSNQRFAKEMGEIFK